MQQIEPDAGHGIGRGGPGISGIKYNIKLLLNALNAIYIGMAKRTPPIYPAARRQLVALGQRLRAARLRRDLTQAMLAERVGVTVPTIAKLESGVATTSLSTMLRVLQSLGFAADIDAIAAMDEQGRALQDDKLSRAAPKRSLRQ